MPEFELKGPNGRVTIEWGFDGDYIVLIDANVQNYSGHANGHVEKSDFETFISEVTALEKSRNGEASFESAIPGEFEIIIRSIDSVGHLGVFGTLRYEELDGKGHIQKLEFALEFSPDQIERVVAQLASA